MSSSTRLRTDWKLFSTIMLMLAFGLVMVYSASSVVAEVIYKRESWEFAAKQIAFAVAGIAVMMVLKKLDYTRLQHPMMVFVPVGMIAVMLIGVIFVDRAAHRWYSLGGFKLQPSEFAKPVLILFLAWFVSRREKKINDKHTLLQAAIVVGCLTLLIGVGDLGTAAILLVPAAAVFYVAGIERKYFYLTLVLGIALVAGALWQKPYRILRVTSFVGLTQEKIAADPKWNWLAAHIATTKASRDTDHQPNQAKIAVGSGGFSGTGINQGNQKMGFLPEAHTDFIFGVVGEETGMVGCALVLLGYMMIFWRGIRLYWFTPDAFGRNLALGSVTLMIAQALFNMSVVLAMAPTKGIPLPLISYGGSALICTLATLGLLLSVSDRATE